jgi:peroxiredoxin
MLMLRAESHIRLKAQSAALAALDEAAKVATTAKDDKQLADAFLQSKGITFPSLYDPRGEVALAFRDYPANAIPSTIVLDRDGRVAAVYTAAVKPEDLQTVVDRVVKEG